jgi:hypothetical protein
MQCCPQSVIRETSHNFQTYLLNVYSEITPETVRLSAIIHIFNTGILNVNNNKVTYFKGLLPDISVMM